jgi:hypothetical protein
VRWAFLEFLILCTRIAAASIAQRISPYTMPEAAETAKKTASSVQVKTTSFMLLALLLEIRNIRWRVLQEVNLYVLYRNMFAGNLVVL